MVAPRRSSGSCRLWWPWGAVPDRKVRQGSQGSRQSCACRLPLLANRGLVEAKWPRVKSAPGCSGCRLLQLPPFGWSFVRPPLCWRSAAICFVFVGTVAPRAISRPLGGSCRRGQKPRSWCSLLAALGWQVQAWIPGLSSENDLGPDPRGHGDGGRAPHQCLRRANCGSFRSEADKQSATL